MWMCAASCGVAELRACVSLIHCFMRCVASSKQSSQCATAVRGYLHALLACRVCVCVAARDGGCTHCNLPLPALPPTHNTRTHSIAPSTTITHVPCFHASALRHLSAAARATRLARVQPGSKVRVQEGGDYSLGPGVSLKPLSSASAPAHSWHSSPHCHRIPTLTAHANHPLVITPRRYPTMREQRQALTMAAPALGPVQSTHARTPLARRPVPI